MRLSCRRVWLETMGQGEMMPLTFGFSSNGHGVDYVAVDHVTGGELISAVRSIVARDLAARPVYYSFVDFDGVSRVDVSAHQLRELVALSAWASQSVPKGHVVAIYAESAAPFALAQMWQALVSAIGWETGVFRERAAAFSWLQEQVAAGFDFRVSVEDLAAHRDPR